MHEGANESQVNSKDAKHEQNKRHRLACTGKRLNR